jgi:hypothetical protein
MSVQKIHTIGKAQKDQGECGKCKKPLLAGEPYIWWTMGFRAKHKNKRCTANFCYPAPSERETTKVATVYAAQESFEASIDGMESPDEIESAVEAVAEAAREVAEEYREAADLWENGNSQLEELAEHYESQADEMESWENPSGEEPEKCEVHADDDTPESNEGCPECEEEAERWIEEIRESAIDHVQNFESL